MNQKAELPGRVPPYSEEAERALLGCMMVDHQHTFDACIQQEVSDTSFYAPAHRKIFLEMLDMINKGKPVELTTLRDSLKSKNHLDDVGGYDYLEQLVEQVTTTAHADFYAAELRDRHRRREIIAKAHEMENAAWNDYDRNSQDILSGYLTEMFSLAQVTTNIKTNFEAIKNKVKEWMETLRGDAPGLPCYLKDLAKILGHFRFGKIYFIGAAPTQGKSTLMTNLAMDWAKRGHPVAIASIEMEHEDIVGRMLADVADVSSFSLDTGWNNDNQAAARIEKVQSATAQFVKKDGSSILPIFINDRNMDIDQFCMWVRLMVHRHGIKAVCLDYIQILTEPKVFRGRQKEYLTECANKIRELAKELNITIVILSQLSGEGAYGGKPNPKDLFGARALQQAAYGILMIYKEEDQTFVDVQKNRGGLVGRCYVTFQKNRQRFICTTEDNIENIEEARKAGADVESGSAGGYSEGDRDYIAGVGEVEYGLSDADLFGPDSQGDE